MKIRAKRLGNFRAEHGPDRLAGDAAHHFADQIALRQTMIAARRARLPIRRLRREQAGRLFPVIQIILRHRFFPARQAGRMAHQMADFHIGFAVCGKFGPVFCDRRIKIERAAIGKQQRGQRRHRLCRRVDIDDGIFFPRRGLRFVCMATPEIGHRLAVDGRAERRANVRAAREIGFKRRADGREFFGRKSLTDAAHVSCPCFLAPALRRDARSARGAVGSNDKRRPARAPQAVQPELARLRTRFLRRRFPAIAAR